ncbi:hypothetical protein RIF29_16059 [Crotalaria pallida]|uniref:RING-CH-type domain-containing protein n=1 Tax=Crotalaria pallida TaxID=3830 RepID=A0AAN9FGJ8_CROPI
MVGLLLSSRVFEENCQVCLDEKVEFMKPDIEGCNAALEGCCCELESGLEDKINELKVLMGNLGSVESTILSCLNDGGGKDWNFDEETFCGVVKEYIRRRNVKGLANLIIEVQKLEPSNIVVGKSIGYGIVYACVIGLSDKARSIVDEMNALGDSVGLGVYVPILKAYCKENQTAEATQLVTEISGSGLRLDVETYDSLIEAWMSSQDFCPRPELMAAFLDEVGEDPRMEVGTHDWNSIIHAFCKAGRLEDARRTFRRMTFWKEVKGKLLADEQKGIKFDHNLIDAFLYALVKGGFFNAVMQFHKLWSTSTFYLLGYQPVWVCWVLLNKMTVTLTSGCRTNEAEHLARWGPKGDHIHSPDGTLTFTWDSLCGFDINNMSHVDLEEGHNCHFVFGNESSSGGSQCLSDADDGSSYSHFYSANSGDCDDYSVDCVSDIVTEDEIEGVPDSSRASDCSVDDCSIDCLSDIVVEIEIEGVPDSRRASDCSVHDYSVDCVSDIVFEVEIEGVPDSGRASDCSVDDEVANEDSDINAHLAIKEESGCRICHGGLESDCDQFGLPIYLGCSCKGDLAAVHKDCAETWFKRKGNRTCEICNSVAENLHLSNEGSPEHLSDNDGATGARTLSETALPAELALVGELVLAAELAVAAEPALAREPALAAELAYAEEEPPRFRQCRRLLNTLFASIALILVVFWLSHIRVGRS